MAKIQFTPVLILRIAQVANTILILGLSANTIHGTRSITRGFYSYSYYNDTDAFTVFLTVWTLLLLTYQFLAPLFLSAIAKPIISLSLELVTVIFWFCDWIALAALWAPFRCHNVSFCSTGKASAAFAAINWALFLATFVLIVLRSKNFIKHGILSMREPFEFGGVLPIQSTVAPPAATATDIEHQQVSGIDLDTNLSNKETFSPQPTVDTLPATNNVNTQPASTPAGQQQTNNSYLPPAGTNL